MLPEPIITIAGKGIHMYGVCIAVGILLCLVVFFLYTKKRGMPNKLQDFVFFVAIFAIALGMLFAKVFQAFYNLLEGKGFNFYTAGFTFMGGLIGGVVAFLSLYFGAGHFYFRGKNKGIHIKYFKMLLNVAPCCITIAHAFGRLGCLMSGCCHGAYLGSDYVFGGIWMRGTTGVWGFYVPVQLYEALVLFALFAVLSVLYFKRVNILMSIYLYAYAVWRFLIEFARTDERGFFLGLYPSQWQSILFVVAGVLLMAFMYIRKIPFVSKQEITMNNKDQSSEEELTE